jgi:thioredoxin reductase (NADPH)
MKNRTPYPIAVVGGGAAGVMAVLRVVLNNQQCLFFPGSIRDKKRSRAFWVKKIENIPGFFNYKRGIDEPNGLTLKWIENSKFKDKLVYMKQRGVESIHKNAEGFELVDSSGDSYQAQYVILATGLMDIQPHIQGKIDAVFPFANMQTVDYCLRCDGHHSLGKHTAIIGHNTGAAWVAIMLHERYQNPSMKILTNGLSAHFDDSVLPLLELYNIEVYEEEILEMKGTPKDGGLEGVYLEGDKFIQVEFVFVSLGMMVYNKLAKDLGAELDSRGFVKTDNKGASSVPGLYIAGDLMAGVKKQVYTAWDKAVDTVDAIDALLRREKREALLKD